MVNTSTKNAVRLSASTHRGMSATGLDLQSPEGREMAALAQHVLSFNSTLKTSFFWWSETRKSFYLIDLVSSSGEKETSVTLMGDSVSQLPFGLTARELDVLTMLTGGLSNSEMAVALFSSPRTVTTHVDRVLRKLNVDSRTAAATLAVERRFVRLPLPGKNDSLERLLLGVLGGEGPAHEDSPVNRTRRRSETLVIGAAFPLSGRAASDGLEMLRATNLAIEEINSVGGVAGRHLNLITCDVDIESRESVETAFRNLVDLNVDALASGYLAYQEVAHSIAAEYGAPYLNAATLDSMVGLVAQEPELFANVFQICPSDVHYGPGFITALSWLRDSGAWAPPSSRLAVVRGSWRHGNLGLERMYRLAESANWVVEECVDEVGDPTETDSPLDAWRKVGTKVAGSDPAAVLIGCYYLDETVSFIRAFRSVNKNSLLYCLYTPSIPEFRAQLGDLAEGVLWATTTGTYSDRIGGKFATSFSRRFGLQPGRSHAGIAYDRVNLLAGAWSRGSNPYDFGQVTQSLRRLQHRGVNGSYLFDNPGQSTDIYPLTSPDPSVSQAHLVFQIQHGKQRVLWPPPYAETDFTSKSEGEPASH